MKYGIMLMVIAYGLNAFGYSEKSLFETFKKLNIKTVPLSDLTADAKLPLMVLPLTLPNVFHKPIKAKVNLWAIGCAPCLVKMEQTWKNPETYWINIDDRPEDIQKASNWLKSKKFNITAYRDFSKNIEKQIGEKFPIPIELNLEKSKLKKLSLGWDATL